MDYLITCTQYILWCPKLANMILPTILLVISKSSINVFSTFDIL